MACDNAPMNKGRGNAHINRAVDTSIKRRCSDARTNRCLTCTILSLLTIVLFVAAIVIQIDCHYYFVIVIIHHPSSIIHHPSSIHPSSIIVVVVVVIIVIITITIIIIITITIITTIIIIITGTILMPLTMVPFVELWSTIQNPPYIWLYLGRVIFKQHCVSVILSQI